MDLYLRVVADDEAVCAWPRVGPLEHDVAPDQARLHTVGEVGDPRAAQHDRMLDLRALDHDLRADRRIRTDVGIDDAAPGADDRRPAHGRALQDGARADRHASLDARVDQLAVVRWLEVLEDQAVGLEQVLDLAGVLPPAGHGVGLDPQPAVDQILDRVGDLELDAP